MSYFIRTTIVPAILALFVFSAAAQAQFGLDLGPLHVHTDGDGGTSVHIGRVIGVDTAPGEGSDVHVTRFINVDTTDGTEVQVGRRHIVSAEGQSLWEAVDADVTAFLAEEAAKPEAKTLETLAAEYENSQSADMTEALWLLDISLRAKNDAGIQNAVREMKKWADAGQELPPLAMVYAYGVSQYNYPKLAGLLCETLPAESLESGLLLRAIQRKQEFSDKEMADWLRMRMEAVKKNTKNSLGFYQVGDALAGYAATLSRAATGPLGLVEFASIITPEQQDAYGLAVDFYRKALETPLTEDEVKILDGKSSVALTSEQLRKYYHVRVLDNIAECYRLAGEADAAQKATQEAADFREKNGI